MGTSDQGNHRRGGTIYGHPNRLRLPRDRHLRIALAVGGAGTALGALLASGALPGGDGRAGGHWVRPDLPPAGPGGTAAGAGLLSRPGAPAATAPSPGTSPTSSPALPTPSPAPSSPPPSSPAPAASGGIRAFRSTASSLCLAAPANGVADAYQMACADAPGPRWLPATVRPGVVALVSVATGRCLAVDAPDGGDGTPVRQRPCTGGEHQQWRLTAMAGGTVPAPPAIALISVYSGRCVTLPVSPPVGPPLRQTRCQGTPDQQWIEHAPK